MLATVFGIHHLAIDDASSFGQRPKLEDYDDFTQLVAYGVQDGTDDLVEVHFFYSTRYLVTVRHGDCAAFAEARSRLAHRARPGQNFGWMIQRIGSLGAFLVVGLGTELVIVGGMLAVFRRRGWL